MVEERLKLPEALLGSWITTLIRNLASLANSFRWVFPSFHAYLRGCKPTVAKREKHAKLHRVSAYELRAAMWYTSPSFPAASGCGTVTTKCLNHY